MKGRNWTFNFCYLYVNDSKVKYTQTHKKTRRYKHVDNSGALVDRYKVYGRKALTSSGRLDLSGEIRWFLLSNSDHVPLIPSHIHIRAMLSRLNLSDSIVTVFIVFVYIYLCEFVCACMSLCVYFFCISLQIFASFLLIH